MKRLDSFWLLLLLLPTFWLFLVTLLNYRCIPAEYANTYLEDVPNIASEMVESSASCFFVQDEIVRTINKHAFQENTTVQNLIIILNIVCAILVIKPLMRFRRLYWN